MSGRLAGWPLFAVGFMMSFLFLSNAYSEAITVRERVENGEAWSELTMNGRGVIVKNGAGSELIVIDRFGGIYINGHVYINNKLVDSAVLDSMDKLKSADTLLTRVTLLNIAFCILISVAISVLGRRQKNRGAS